MRKEINTIIISFAIIACIFLNGMEVKAAGDSFGSAKKISVNTTVTDKMSSYNEEDFFKFETTGNGYITIKFGQEYNSGTSDAWHMYLYNENRELILDKKYYYDDPHYTYTTQIGIPKGTYYIKITTASVWSDDPYEIRVDYKVANNWEKEFNETYSTADVLTLNSKMNGAILEYGDEDFYKFTVTDEGYITIAFGHEYVDSSSEYWHLYLYNEDREELYDYKYYGDDPALITSGKYGLPAGTYYVRVTNASSSHDTPYTLQVDFTETNGWETEINDSFSTADSMSVNTAIKGNMPNYYDEDYYVIDIPQTRYYRVSFSHEVTEDDWTFCDVELYDSNYSSVIEYSYKGNVKEKIENKIELEKGKYYLKVEPGNDYNKEYSLKLGIAGPVISSLKNTSSGIQIKWNQVEGASKYYVYRKVGTGSWKQVKTTTSTSWTNTSVSNGVKYVYKIYPYTQEGKGLAGATKTTYRITAPSIESVSNSKSRALKVKYSKNTKASGYQIYYGRNSDFSNCSKVKIASKDTVSKTLSGLTKNKTYYVKVRAYKTVNGSTYYSAWSGVQKKKVK